MQRGTEERYAVLKTKNKTEDSCLPDKTEKAQLELRQKL